MPIKNSLKNRDSFFIVPLIQFFISGFLLMCFEILLPRIFSIHYGSSFLVWSATIASVMIWLFLGNGSGHKLVRIFSSSWTVCGSFWILSVHFVFLALLRDELFLFLGSLPFNESWIIIITALTLTFPPSFLSGVISTVLLGERREKEENGFGKTGKLLASNAAGSITGTLVPSFFLVPFWGMENSLWILGITASIAGIFSLLVASPFLSSLKKEDKKGLASSAQKTRILFLSFSAIMLVFLFFALSAETECSRSENKTGKDVDSATLTTVDEFDTPYIHIKIADLEQADGVITRLLLNGVTIYSAWRPMDPEWSSEYIKYFHIPFAEKSDIKDVLVIGAGGYCFPKQILSRYKNVLLDVVDIDEKMVEKVKKYFNVPSTSRMTTFIADGRRFVETTDKKYDFVAVDVYQGKQIPGHMTTREFFESIKRTLKNEDSYLVVNLIAVPGGKFYQAFRNTLEIVFGDVRTYPVSDPEQKEKTKNTEETKNILVIAKNREHPPGFPVLSKGQILVDDKSASDILLEK